MRTEYTKEQIKELNASIKGKNAMKKYRAMITQLYKIAYNSGCVGIHDYTYSYIEPIIDKIESILDDKILCITDYESYTKKHDN